jgi:hypothetical protein
MDDLESRLLLSFTPAQVSHAYGVDQIMFGSVKGDGTGQTIAIVDAYNTVNIASDLKAFNAAFGLPDTDGTGQQVLTVANPQGVPTKTDTWWSEEATLDVEWAHAIAPGAHILLVQTSSNSWNDLMAGVDYARKQPGVSVVSMSWGQAEFAFQAFYDSTLTTPSGHTAVSFVASAGDSGGARLWPALSTNVLSVGGTSLYTSDSLGTYSSEKAWSGSGGGVSAYEAKPSYQSSVTQSTTNRVGPDVAWVADGSTGVQCYFNGSWTTFGGTSVGAPQWAALVAIANQGRALAGKDPLDGLSQLLPAIYNMPASNFHDITTGGSPNAAGPGFDLVTGRGSPYADRVVADLVNTNADGTISNPTAYVGSVAASSQNGALTYGTAGSTTYTITVNRGTATGAFDSILTVTAGLPAGSTYSFTVGGTVTNTLHFNDTDNSLTATLTVSTATKTPAGNFTLGVKAERVDASGNLTGDLATGTGTLAVGKRALTVTATGQNRVYDGTKTDTVSLSDNRLAGDSLTIGYTTATFADKNVGAGKAVSVSGITLTGADAGNYTVNTTASTTASITAKALTGTVTAANKVYDGTTAAGLAARILSGVVAGDTVSYLGGTAVFSTKTAGTGKTVTVTGLTLSGTDAANYTVNTTATTTANITPRALVISATGQDKVYDGTTAATVTLSDNRITGDALTTGYTTAAFSDKNVGTGKTISVTGITLSGTDAGNYTFSTTASTTGSITPRALVISATGQNRIYDGTTTGAVSLSDNRVSGDALTTGYATAAFSDKNVGTGKAISVTGITLSGTDAGNYSFNTTASTTGNITAKTLVGSITAANKVYDGTTAATLTSRTLAGVVAGDSVSYVGGTATFDTKDVGTGKTVTATGLGLSGTDATNYTVNTSATTTANISAASLQVLTVTATGINKVYDGTTAATVTLSDNRISGDVLTVSYTSASFADKNVGTGKSVTVSGITISGADAGNYSLAATTITTTASITPRALAISATGQNKVYDGTTAATVTLSDNRVSGDVLTASYTTATFSNKNVGTGKTISVTGITLTGTDAGNYTFNTAASTTANITSRALTIAATGHNKVYDGTTAATVTLSDNRVSGDVLRASYTTATFSNKNVGTGKTISVTGITLAGTDAGNYTFNTTASTTANITPRALTIAATGQNKVYDGTTAATVTLADNRITGDVLTTGYTTAAFGDKNVGAGKTISVTGITLSGTDAGNYSFNTTASTTANITPRALVIAATGQNKVYDGTTAATVTLSDNRVSGDALTTGYTIAVFGDKNVGTGKTISVTGITLTGTDSGNYTFNTTASTSASITPRALAIAATGHNKVYDGTTAATVSLSDNRITGDVLTTGLTTAVFSDKNAGTGKSITVSGITLGGTDAGNYTFNTTASTTASITAKALVGSVTVADKVYDRTTTATITSRTLSGVVAGDAVSYVGGTARFSSRNVGTEKTVTATGLGLSGANAGNYTVNTSATTTASITPRRLRVSPNVQNKTYDGTTAAKVTLTDDRVSGDSLTTGYGSASFADKNVGADKLVTVVGITLSGADAANYTFSTTTGTGGSADPNAADTTTASATGDIDALPITVTADAKTKTAGSADPAFTWQLTAGTLVGGDTLSGALTRAPGENAGSYAISQGTLSAGSNYSLTFVGSTLTIVPSAAYDLSGPWTTGGKLASISQSGNTLAFTDPAGVSSTGSFTGASAITGRSGLTATIDTSTADQGRILWSDGTIWLRVSVGGEYYNPANNQLTAVLQNGTQLTFVNAGGGTSTGSLLGANQVAATDWQQTATFQDGMLTFANGNVWTKLDLSPTYTNVSGESVGVIQNSASTSLVFVNKAGGTSSGSWLSPTQIAATDWGVTGTVRDGQIFWSNGSVWNKNLVASATGGGTGLVSVTATNAQIILTNKSGGTSRAEVTAAGTLVALDWGGVTGTQSNGRILWSNGTVWDNFDFNALDAVFSDIRTYPFGS